MLASGRTEELMDKVFSKYQVRLAINNLLG